MSLDDIKEYLNQIKEYTDFVYLHVLGEPLLHPDIKEIFEYCNNLKINIQLVTNGILLNKYQDLVNYPSLRKISISLHSVNNMNVKEEYFKTIDYLIDNTDKYLELRFYNSQNLDDKLKMYLDSLYKKYDVVSTDRYNSYKLKDNVYIRYSDLFKWPDINDPVISEKGKCLGGIDQLAILHDGTVTLCCLDPYGLNSLGNLKEKSLKEILKSNEYNQVISDLRNGKLGKDLCTKCSYRLRFDDKNN